MTGRTLAVRRGIVELERHQLRTHEGNVVRLSANEVSLLDYLATASPRPVSRKELLTMVWGYAPTVSSRAADRAVIRLRKKLERHPRSPDHLVTAHGYGYAWVPLRPELPALPPVEGGPWVERLVRGSRVTAVVGPCAVDRLRRSLEGEFDGVVHMREVELPEVEGRVMFLIERARVDTLAIVSLHAQLAQRPHQRCLLLLQEIPPVDPVRCPWVRTVEQTTPGATGALPFLALFPNGAPPDALSRFEGGGTSSVALETTWTCDGPRLHAPDDAVPDAPAVRAFVDWALTLHGRALEVHVAALEVAVRQAVQLRWDDEAAMLLVRRIDAVGRYAGAMDVPRTLLDRLPSGSTSWERVLARLRPEDLAEVPDVEEALRRVVDGSADPTTRSCALQRLAGLAHDRGDQTKALRMLQRVVVDREALPRVRLQGALRRAMLLLFRQPDGAREAIETGLAEASERRIWRLVASYMALSASLEANGGSCGRAVAIYDGLLPLLQTTGARRAYYAMLGERALTGLVAGASVAACLGLVDAGLVEARTEGSTYGVATLQACQGSLLAHLGEREAARWSWAQARGVEVAMVQEFITFEEAFFRRSWGEEVGVPDALSELGDHKRRFLQGMALETVPVHVQRWKLARASD